MYIKRRESLQSLRRWTAIDDSNPMENDITPVEKMYGTTTTIHINPHSTQWKSGEEIA